MNRFFSALVLLLVTGFLSSCAKKTVAFKTDGKMEEYDPSYAQYGFLDAKAKIVVEEESGKITRGTLSLRAKKDSILWFTISPGMGMEAIRGLITKEKIQIKDRIGKGDVNMSFKEFETIYGLKLSLDLFQNLLWANPPHPFDYKDRLLRVGKSFEITQVRDKVRYFSKIDVNHKKLAEMVSNSLDDRGSLLASFSSFQEVHKQALPSKVRYKLAYQLPKGAQNTLVHLEWTSINLNSANLSFPFRF